MLYQLPVGRKLDMKRDKKTRKLMYNCYFIVRTKTLLLFYCTHKNFIRILYFLSNYPIMQFFELIRNFMFDMSSDQNDKNYCYFRVRLKLSHDTFILSSDHKDEIEDFSHGYLCLMILVTILNSCIN